MTGDRAELRAECVEEGTHMVRPALRPNRRSAFAPIALTVACVLVLALVLGACGASSSPPSSQMPAQLSPEQILAGVLAATGSAAGGGSGEAFVQGQGDILCEPAGTAGPESFAGEVHVVRGPTTTFSIPGTTTTRPQTTLAPGQVTSWPGGTPGLYGGSRSKAVCDKEAQLRFLEQNPDKAAAFCAALNSDPALRWSGGSKVVPNQLRAYFAELTPLILTRDTRVTNHGFRNGLPTPRQSVLQAGQGVLVDKYGVPRVRCECGNPLNPPQPVKTTPNYTGAKWEGFDPTVIIVVQQTTVIVETFVLVEVETGQIIDRPAGTSGERDVPHATTTSSTTVLSTTTSITTTSSGATSTKPQGDGKLDISTYVVDSSNVDVLKGATLEMWHRGDWVELRGPTTIRVEGWSIDSSDTTSDIVNIAGGNSWRIELDEYSATHPSDWNYRITLLSGDTG